MSIYISKAASVNMSSNIQLYADGILGFLFIPFCCISKYYVLKY